MLSFTIFGNDANQNVYVDPLQVESVVETRARTVGGGWVNTAIITMRSGDKHTVYDYSVGKQISEAQAKLGIVERPVPQPSVNITSH